MPDNKKKRITSIKQIAEIAGCSIATVSNTLNKKGRIGEQVQKKIWDICKKHGYLPNSAGRNLRRQRTETVGIMFFPSCASLFRNTFYADVMEALEEEMERNRYDLLLSSFGTTSSCDEPPRFIRQGKVDGIILLGGFPQSFVQQIYDFGVPLLLLDSHQESINVDSITTDGYSASLQIVDKLIKHGHRRIAFMAHRHEDYNANHRAAGFHAGITKYSLPESDNPIIRNFQTSSKGYEALKQCLNQSAAPTAVVCVNDQLASAIQVRLRNDGYNIPGDFSIFGFDDDYFSRDAIPAISTVRIDKGKLGRLGAETILRRINDPDAPIISQRIPTQLTHRDSVGPPLK
jgi:LacI family transcriptional regulator